MKNFLNDPRHAIHLSLIAVLLWLAIVLALPGATFDSSIFSAFAKIASEPVWAFALQAGGMFGLLGLLTNRNWVRLLSIYVMATMHGTIAVCFLLGTPAGNGPVGTAPGTYAVIASLGYYLAYSQSRPRITIR